MANQASYKSVPVRSSEITPEHLYRSRRQFLKQMGVLGAGALLAACAPGAQPTATPPAGAAAGQNSDELGDPLNTWEQITGYNNYYEFSTDKEDVAGLASGMKTAPWTIEVTGLVGKPQTFGIEDLLKRFDQEERIYRLRCVEAWSMVIPWTGFQLSELLQAVEPAAQAKYVRFVSLLDPQVFPGQKSAWYPWPYQEGLTVEEAMNPLTIIATGLYGQPMPPQNGAPTRLVVPWKYGFKSIKAIVRIELVDTQPETLWSAIQPNEYGFYANVNPQVDHPRWSQASERRIGEGGRRPTLMFNGYAEQVAHLYQGMDLKVNY